MPASDLAVARDYYDRTMREMQQQNDKLRHMLQAIDGAAEVKEVALYPGWRLHPMTGDWKGFWSLTVSGNWRLLFRFENGDAFDLLLHDPH